MNKKIFMFLALFSASAFAMQREDDAEYSALERVEDAKKLDKYYDMRSRWQQIKDPEQAKEMLARGLKPPRDILHIVAEPDYHPDLIKLYRPFGKLLLPNCVAKETDWPESLLEIKNKRLAGAGLRNRDLEERLPIEILVQMHRSVCPAEIDEELNMFKVPRKFYDSTEDIAKKFDGFVEGCTDEQVLEIFNHKAKEKCDVRSILRQDCPYSLRRIAFPLNWAFANNDAQFLETAPILLQRIDEICNRIKGVSKKRTRDESLEQSKK